MAVGALAKVQNFQNKTVEEVRGRFYGRYMGFVRDRADPAKLGRVRCYVPAIIPTDSPKHWLDWCMPSSAALAVPPMYAPIWIEFEHGHVQSGIYTWGWFKGDDADSSTAPAAAKGQDDPTWVDSLTAKTGGFGGDISATMPADTAKANKPEYPYDKVFVSEGGHRFEVDDSPGKPRLRYYHPKGTTLLIDSDGSVHIRSAGAQYHHSEGDYVVMLGQGATFKVVYPGGSGLAVGASGVTVNGHQVRIMGRPIIRSAEPLGGTS